MVEDKRGTSWEREPGKTIPHEFLDDDCFVHKKAVFIEIGTQGYYLYDDGIGYWTRGDLVFVLKNAHGNFYW